MIERVELIDVQTFVTQPTVEGLTKPVLDRFSRPNEIKLHAALATHALMVYESARTSKHDVDSRIAKARTRRRHFPDPHPPRYLIACLAYHADRRSDAIGTAHCG